MNTYSPGPNTDDANNVLVNGKPLDLKLNIRNHSPSGFAWGYSGSGPAQLALAIMCFEFGDNLEQHPIDYYFLKDKVIAKLPLHHKWTLTSKDIKTHISQIQTQIVENLNSKKETQR